MKVTVRRIGAVGSLAAVAAIALLPPGADAHHPEISVSASCADGLTDVRIVAEAWESDGPGHRDNADVQVTFNGQTVGRGAFNAANNYTFTVVHRAPADGRTYTVRATSIAPWGFAGEFGSAGEFREASVTLPTNCEATPTTTAAPTTTAPAPTTTTVATGGGSATSVTSTTAPAVVGGVIETRPDVAAPVAVQPRFAG